MIKLKALKLANAIKVGPGEETFFRENSYDICFVDQVVLSVTHRKSNQTTFTSIFNTVYWDADPNTYIADKSSPSKKDAIIKAKGINEQPNHN